MKRILILTGATLVAFAASAREILYVGATGGSWQAIGNWVSRETEQPITELWDGDIACFNPGKSISLEVVNNASGVLNFGGIKVLSGAVTVSGWNNMHFCDFREWSDVGLGIQPRRVVVCAEGDADGCRRH